MGYQGKVLGWALLALAMAWGGQAAADSWMPPHVETYWSPGRTARVTITPRSIKDRLSYYQDKVDGKASAGQQPGGAVGPRALVERCDATARCARVWEGPLVNELAPVSALVDDTGEHMVTFDNWGSVGFGPHVVVIYGPGGAVIRSLSLGEILPETYIEALQRTVSSVWWGGEHTVVGPDLVLRISGPRGEAPPAAAFEVKIDLATGRVQPPSGPAFDAAMAAAAPIAAEVRAERARRIAWATEPLVAPASAEEEDGVQYLTEAFFRLAPDWRDGYPRTAFLSPPQAEDYARTLAGLRYALRRPDVQPGDTAMFGSPDQDNLVAVLTRLGPTLAPKRAGGLKGVRIYVAVDDGRWPAVVSALGRSGAELIQLDPRKPIPQRPERLPGTTE